MSLVVEPQASEPKTTLRRFQFSMRTLLVFVMICAIACCWVAVRNKNEQRERAVVERLHSLGGRADVGYDLFSNITELDFSENGRVTDGELEHLRGLSELRRLYLFRTSITDAGLEHLKGLGHLRELELIDTNVTDVGVKKLQQALPNCNIYRSPPTCHGRKVAARPPLGGASRGKAVE